MGWSLGTLLSNESAGEGGKVSWFVVMEAVDSFVVVGKMKGELKRTSQSTSFTGLNDNDDNEKRADISVSNPLSPYKGVVLSS